MFDRWFFTHYGQTYGPVSTAEMQKLAATGKLLPQDLLWPESVDAKQAVPASTAIDFQAILRNALLKAGQAIALRKPADTNGLPAWVASLQQVEDSPPQPKKPALPDWLEDVRRSEGR